MSTDTQYCSVAEFYEFLPIDRAKRHIRVIDLYAPTTPFPFEEPLAASMRIVELDSDDRPRYATLSYVWGDEADQNSPTIELNFDIKKTLLNLTINCHTALLNLRAKLGAFTIWVDAICINQNTGDEKSHQVSQMGEIYQLSEPTYIWLQSVGENSERDIDVLASINHMQYFFDVREHRYSTKIRPRPVAASFALFKECYFYNIARFRRPFFRGKPSLNLTNLEVMNQEWLYRMWTYQEVMLAQRSIVVVGQTHVPLLRLLMGVNFIDRLRHTTTESLFDKRFSASVADWQELFLDILVFRARKAKFARDDQAPALRPSILKTHYTFMVRTNIYWIVLNILFSLSLAVLFVCLEVFSPGENAPLVTVCTLGLMLNTVWFFMVISWGNRFYLSRKSSRIPNRRYLKPLKTLASRKCKAPRDYNFALRSVFQFLDADKVPSLDYSLPLELVNQDLSYHLLRTAGELQALHAAILFPCHQGTPSWVADWNRFSYIEQSSMLWSRRCDDDSTMGPLLPGARHIVPIEDTMHSQQDLPTTKINSSDRNILQVLARDVGAPVKSYRFRRTNATFSDLEIDAHVHNLQTLAELLHQFGISKLFDFFCTEQGDNWTAEKFRRRFKKTLRYVHRNSRDFLSISLGSDIDKDVQVFCRSPAFETLITTFNDTMSENLSLTTMKPKCGCRKCGPLLGVVKTSGEADDGLYEEYTKKVLKVARFNESILVIAHPRSHPENPALYKMVGLCDYLLPASFRRPEIRPSPICPKLRSEALSYFDIC